MEQLEFQLLDQNRRLSSLEWQYRYSGESLVETVNRRQLVYGHWDHLFGCWQSGPSEKSSEFIPNWPIFTVNGTWCDPVDHICIRFNCAQYAFTPKWHRQANAAFAAYFSSIPRPYRSLVGPLGNFQWLALDLIWQCEDFARHLDQELLQNNGHFVCAMFVIADAFSMTRSRRGEFARELISKNRTELVRTYTGSDQARSLEKLISSPDNETQSSEYYSTLVEVMKCPSKAKLVAHNSDLTWEKLELLRDLPECLLSSGVLNLSDDDFESIDQLRRISGYLADLPNHIEQSISQSIKARGKIEKLKSRIHKWEIKLRQLVKFPGSPIPAHRLLTPLDSPHEMYREGLKMSNCLFELVEDALDGDAYFYHWRGEEPATVMLVPSSKGGWELAGASGNKNQTLSQKTIQYIEAIVEKLTERRVEITINELRHGSGFGSAAVSLVNC
jgi:hypothetical protein